MTKPILFFGYFIPINYITVHKVKFIFVVFIVTFHYIADYYAKSSNIYSVASVLIGRSIIPTHTCNITINIKVFFLLYNQ